MSKALGPPPEEMGERKLLQALLSIYAEERARDPRGPGVRSAILALAVVIIRGRSTWERLDYLRRFPETARLQLPEPLP
jgi:hypothetical protein